MLRSVCRFTLLLLFCGIGHANALLMTPLESLAFTTDKLSLEGTSAQTPITTDSTSTYTATTSEPAVPTSTTYQPASETGTSGATTTQQPTSTFGETGQTTPADLSTYPMSTSLTTVVLTGTTAEPKTITTTLATSEETVIPTNATTPLPTNATTPLPTNGTTVGPTNATTPLPTNGTTVGPTNATTPLPTNGTTVGPTNATTIVTTASTPVPTTVPPLPNPTVGEYAIRADPNSSVCLMAKMGLQFSFSSVEGKFQTVNLDPMPNVTTINGTCGWNGSDAVLVLESDKITVQFVFARQMGKFHLSTLNFTVATGSGSPFSAASTNLSLWEASLGSSYMCQKEQSYNITDHLILNTFQLQVQPFNVTNNSFSTAHECSVDDSSLLIPIIVGAALAGLILVVVIAYVIGRRKTYVGYQTL